MEKDFKLINQKDIYQYKFYMIPKELFVNERYISLSPAAILLYGILLDRLTLSIKNNWVDKNGNIYLIFTRKEIESILHISDKTCTKTFKELVDAKLLLEKSQGKAKPKLLYPAQMIHDEKFDNLTRKNSDSRGVNSTTKEKIRYRIENKIYNQVYIPKKKYKMSIEEYNRFKQKQRKHQLRELPALYILICLLLKIDPLPEKIEIKDYKVPITKEMKISIKHLESLSQQTILLAENRINNLEELKSYRYNLEENLRILKGKREHLWRKRKKEKSPEIKEKITHEIGDLKVLINKYNKDIVNCYEIENRTILLKNQLEIEKPKEIVKSKKRDRVR